MVWLLLLIIVLLVAILIAIGAAAHKLWSIVCRASDLNLASNDLIIAQHRQMAGELTEKIELIISASSRASKIQAEENHSQIV